MCTGRPPFRAETNYGVLRRITDNEPRRIREVNPAIPEWFEGTVNKLLAKDVSQRFQSAHEVAELLEQCLAHVQQPTTVALPKGCRESVSGRSRAPRSWPRRVLGFIALGMMTSFAVMAFQNMTTSRDSTGETKSATIPTESAPESSRPSANVAWDAAESDLSAFSHDLAPFESRSQQLWDKSPAMKKE